MEKLETLLALEREEIITKYEQEVGYFQGMNEVVAVLLMFLNEDDTFWSQENLPSLSIQGFSICDLSTQSMCQRVSMGIPPPVRGQAWSLLWDLEKVKAENIRKYQRIKERARRCGPDVKHRDVDVNRTFRNNLFFWERQQALFHVLVAYSMYDSENICTPRPCPFQGAFLLVTNQEHPGAEVGLSGGDREASMWVLHTRLALAGEQMSVGIYTPTWSMQCFINQSLPGPPPGPHDRPDSVTPPRPRQPAPPSLLKTAPLGPGHPSCPEAAEASIPPMSDQYQHSHDGARTAPQELRQDPTQPHDPLSSVSIGSLDVQGPPEDEVTVSTGTPRSPEASKMPCFFTLSFLEDGPYPYPHIAQVPDSKGPEFGLQESRGCVSTPQPGL
ncbi:hypothetical protein MJT46_006716 [Ovis ammon polii x Ovis aries]|nr:hypothetical protein MJT46_006716 [Ovis ammon polii x Ovis aries]